MVGKMRRVKFLTRALLSFNVLACVYMTFAYLPITSKFTSQMELLRRSRMSPFYDFGPRSLVKTEDRSQRRIVLFGMRQHWLVFCNFPEFARFKYLIEFPRIISCPEVQCSVFLNYTEQAYEIQSYDIVVFTNVYDWLTPEMWNWLHGNRTEGQRWVMITEESPLYVPGVQPPEKYAKSTFDWFDSYKSDSDFVHPYGYYRPFGNTKPPEGDLSIFLQQKTHLLAWMGSHCETQQWNRMRFVNDLKKLITLDKFGKCGDEEVPWNDDTAILNVLGKYKFYLSLENSCCDDYVTEKFWRALEMGIVPVVLGAPIEHYMKVAPPKSFIHVDQFDSMVELAVYLIKLHGDDKEYLEYFKWRREGTLVSYGQEEQYVRPLSNQTHCALLKKFLTSDPADQSRLDYFGKKWYGSCHYCSGKKWVNNYMHPHNYSRANQDIWA
ncbi:Alpha-(1,3)-fucosyltransferase 4 [Holothuria leucospilota]|uniref:Fucosyltransferase n=1 Tax=Holothuria leucospilota TaxID=206669 RepID=A0A9Q1CFS7_HOLLE|nr:Alpha-(1,3)-fucosyltransferase 4 [Holothuria leucospilota]